MKILIDTREQQALEFTIGGVLTGVERVKLDVGDYTALYTDGTRCPIVFERKALSDLFGTMTHEYKRFKQELARAKDLKQSLVLAIEGTYTEVLEGYAYSKYSGASMVKKLMTLWQRYELAPMFFESRWAMAHAITEFYEAFGRNYKLKRG